MPPNADGRKVSLGFLRVEKRGKGRIQAYDTGDQETYVSAEIQKGIVETMPHPILGSALSERCF
jgi:hypothetical protein